MRAAQARALAAFIAGHTADCGYPPVITGDLNAEPGSDELRLLGGVLAALRSPGLVLVDAGAMLIPATRDSPGTAATVTRPTARPGFADRLHSGRLARQGRGRVRSVSLAGTAPVDGVWPSDHFAVVAELQQQA